MKNYRIRIRIQWGKNQRIRPIPDPHPCTKANKIYDAIDKTIFYQLCNLRRKLPRPYLGIGAYIKYTGRYVLN